MSKTSGVGGKKREVKDFSPKVGLFEGKVICINPSVEEYKEILGIELGEDSKAADYLGESKDNNTSLRIDFWVEEVKVLKEGEFPFRNKVTFFLENKERWNKDETKQQFINNIGNCSWADDPNNLPDWFVEREYRGSYSGEEELYAFLQKWLGSLDLRDKESTLQLEWKPLMKGNVKELKELIGCEFECNVGMVATVITKENKEGEIKEYQGIYNRAFLPPYALKHFRLVDYSDSDVLAKIAAKKPKDRKIYEKFALELMDSEYGCKDAFLLKDLQDYNASDFIVSGNEVITEGNSKY